MKFEHVRLEAFGYALPEEVVSSEKLEQALSSVYERFNLHVGRLELMTGIRERRFWKKGLPPSHGSTLAGRKAIEAAGLAPGDIGCLLHTSVSRDFLEPATASVVHHNLSLPPEALFFDISNACLGFVNGIITVANMIEMGQIERGLIVAGESSRQLVEATIESLVANPNLTRDELKASFASLTIGSGAVALLLAHEKATGSEHRLIGGAVRAATHHNDLCRGSEDTGFAANGPMVMNTDSEALLNAGCALAAETWDELKSSLDWSEADIDRCYTHQVGSVHRDRLFKAIGYTPKKELSTFEFLGNVGSVSLPLTMAIGLEQEPAESRENIAMLGIGSGLSCTMLGVRW